MTERSLIIPPRDPKAEPVCLLTREWAARRQEPVDGILADAFAVEPLPDGIAYSFSARPGVWERLRVFAEEEGECCPFLEFHLLEQADKLILEVVYPQEESR